MSESPSADHQEDAQIPLIYAPDTALQKRIGVPLKSVFTEERMKQAQMVIQRSSQLLLERCFEDSQQLKIELQDLQQNLNTSSKSFENIAFITLRIKGTAGMVNYLIPTQVANELFKFMQRLQGDIDGAAFTLIKTHIHTINAAFKQRLTGDGTAVTHEVVEELALMVGQYLKHHS